MPQPKAYASTEAGAQNCREGGSQSHRISGQPPKIISPIPDTLKVGPVAVAGEKVIIRRRGKQKGSEMPFDRKENSKEGDAETDG